MSVVVLKVGLYHLNLVDFEGFGLEAALHLTFRPIRLVEGIGKQRLFLLIGDSNFHLLLKLAYHFPWRLKDPRFLLYVLNEKRSIEIHRIYSKLLQQHSLDIVVFVTVEAFPVDLFIVMGGHSDCSLHAIQDFGCAAGSR